MFKLWTRVGLDIGASQLRIAWLATKRIPRRLLGFESINIPPGLAEAEALDNPAGLGALLEDSVRTLGLLGSRVSLSVPGSQVYLRRLTMPCLRFRELRRAVYFKAHGFLPLPVEDAAMDIFPLRYYRDDEGKKVELLFAATRKQIIAQLIALCVNAGLRVDVIEIDSLALYRAWGGDRDRCVLLLHLHPTMPSLTVFSMGIPVFHSSLAPLGSNPEIPIDQKGGYWSGQPNSGSTSGRDARTGGLISQIREAMDYFQSRPASPELQLEAVVMSGGSDIPGFETTLREVLGMPVETAGQKALTQLKLPDGLSDIQKQALEQEFCLALGLAMRG